MYHVCSEYQVRRYLVYSTFYGTMIFGTRNEKRHRVIGDAFLFLGESIRRSLFAILLLMEPCIKSILWNPVANAANSDRRKDFLPNQTVDGLSPNTHNHHDFIDSVAAASFSVQWVSCVRSPSRHQLHGSAPFRN